MKVSEIYYCFSGEGATAGRRCVIVRTAGCHVSCKYCDTKYAQGGGEEVSIDEILGEVRTFDCDFVLLTGGSPLEQPDACFHLVRLLLSDGFEVMVEASGVYDISPVTGLPFVHIDLDVKTPSSGVVHTDVMELNLRRLQGKDEIKFVIGTREDYDFATNFVRRWQTVISGVPIYFSPVWEAGPRFWQRLQGWMLTDKLDVLFSLQIHKAVWGPTQRRV